jgi:TusA-related sulfurtransferase
LTSATSSTPCFRSWELVSRDELAAEIGGEDLAFSNEADSGELATACVAACANLAERKIAGVTRSMSEFSRETADMPLVADKKIDCLGLFCPMPIVKTREALLGMTPGQILEMTSDDPGSEADMKTWSTRTGNDLLGMEKDGAVFRFFVRKTR